MSSITTKTTVSAGLIVAMAGIFYQGRSTDAEARVNRIEQQLVAVETNRIADAMRTERIANRLMQKMDSDQAWKEDVIQRLSRIEGRR